MALAALGAPALTQAAGWTPTGRMLNDHTDHAVAVLADGRVLVSGGTGASVNSIISCGLRTTELFNPATNGWTASGSMSTSRLGHTTTLLPDGRLLAAGGDLMNPLCGFATNQTAELFNPATGTWTNTASMSRPRSGHTATLMYDGRVLVAGGGDQQASAVSPSAEIYDPTSETWSATGSMMVFRAGHTAVPLPDGRVLVLGGNAPTVGGELFDPSTGTWSLAVTLTGPLLGSSPTLLADGRVLIRVSSGFEIYDPLANTRTTVGNTAVSRVSATFTLLSDGRVLAAGGGVVAARDTSELFDPASGTWSAGPRMIDEHSGHKATRLADGRVLLVGGWSNLFGACCAETFSLVGSGAAPEPITVTTPNGGEVWKIGTTQTIRWNVASNTGFVNILLSRDGGTTYYRIAYLAPNTGSFRLSLNRFQIPVTNQARIQVRRVNGPPGLDESDSNFTIIK